ncbi:hypothetical protein [Microbacterium sp. AK009]|uniref:hypothetical protein n=1 Tax=Microbacterium sp. AK009 TaxID=2723068 RepID=UPI001C54385F|nr:hypothetical protein [Microbacterium sp. AK009]
MTNGAVMTAAKRSLWQRLVHVFRPEPETYETRRARPGGSDPGVIQASPLDQRRDGGSGGIGGG